MSLTVYVWTEGDGQALRGRLKRAGLAFSEKRRASEQACPREPLWREMPEYVNDAGILLEFQVRVRNGEEWSSAARAVAQDVSAQRTGKQNAAMWYPPRPRRELQAHIYTVPGLPIQPRYPVYIISKGRWESRLTVKALELMRVHYRIVVEPQEVEQYAAVLPRANILKLPAHLSNLGQGGIPARNYVWEHAKQSGSRRHWILDDNIRHFFRRNHNAKHEVASGAIFRAVEDFVDRWANVPLAGLHYDFFVPDTGGCRPPFMLNTRIYSCILIDHLQIDHLRWRGKYNEDTDLSLRVLKERYCTMLFNAFLQKKVHTMVMKGGNTDSLYKNGRKQFVKSLVKQHPDVTRHVTRYGRDHHHVDYSPFRLNALVPVHKHKQYTARIDNYGMRLVCRPPHLDPRTHCTSPRARSPSKRTASPSKTRA